MDCENAKKNIVSTVEQVFRVIDNYASI